MKDNVVSIYRIAKLQKTNVTPIALGISTMGVTVTDGWLLNHDLDTSYRAR